MKREIMKRKKVKKLIKKAEEHNMRVIFLGSAEKILNKTYNGKVLKKNKLDVTVLNSMILVTTVCKKSYEFD